MTINFSFLLKKKITPDGYFLEKGEVFLRIIYPRRGLFKNSLHPSNSLKPFLEHLNLPLKYLNERSSHLGLLEYTQTEIIQLKGTEYLKKSHLNIKS